MKALIVATLLTASLAAADEPVRYELDGNALKLPGPIVFAINVDKLKPESDAALDHVKGYLEAKPYISLLRVEVHTDAMGDERANQRLSEERARAIVEALVKRGVACDRLIAVGFGGTKPIAPNDTPENRASNRRSLFVNAALKGRPIGGFPVDGGGRVVPTCAK